MATATEDPPRTKKSDSGRIARGPSCSAQRSASQAGVPSSAGRRGLRRRPGEGRAVDLAGRQGGQGAEHDDQRGDARRQPLTEIFAHVVGVDPAGHVADEDAVAGCGGADRSRRGPHAGGACQGGVDLAEFEPATADLDLVVAPADEAEPGQRLPDDVAGPVDALETQGRARRVAFGIERRVEVAGEADAGDHKFTRFAVGDGAAVLGDDGDGRSVERPADHDGRTDADAGGRRDDRRLGRAVRVPDLSACGQAPGELVREGLAAEDQEPYAREGVFVPEGSQRRDGGDDADPPLGDPRTEVGAGADEGPGGGEEGGAVRPRQPDLLAAGVEGDRQAGEDAVVGTDIPELGLGGDERGRRAVADGDALRLAGRSGGEDQPGVVGWSGRPAGAASGSQRDEVEPFLEDRADVGCRPDSRRPGWRVVEIDWYVGGAGSQDSGDRDVEVGGSTWQVNPDTVARADARRGKPLGQAGGLVGELSVGERAVGRLDRRASGVAGGGRGEKLGQRVRPIRRRGPLRQRRSSRRQGELCGDMREIDLTRPFEHRPTGGPRHRAKRR